MRSSCDADIIENEMRDAEHAVAYRLCRAVLTAKGCRLTITFAKGRRPHSPLKIPVVPRTPNNPGGQDIMRYEAPSSTKAAIALLAKERGKAAILAGGTDLLVRMKGG